MWSLQSFSSPAQEQQVGDLIDDLHDTSTITKNGATTCEAAYQPNAASAAHVQSANSKNKKTSQTIEADRTQTVRTTNTTGDINRSAARDNEDPKKIWKPDVPEFVPRGFNGQSPSIKENPPNFASNGNGYWEETTSPKNGFDSSGEADDNLEIITECPIVNKENVPTGASKSTKAHSNGENGLAYHDESTRRTANVASVPSNKVGGPDTQYMDLEDYNANNTSKSSTNRQLFMMPCHKQDKSIRRRMSASEPVETGIAANYRHGNDSSEIPDTGDHSKRPPTSPNQRRRRRNTSQWRNNSRRRAKTQSGGDAVDSLP